MLRINMMKKTKLSAALLLSFCAVIQLSYIPVHAMNSAPEPVISDNDDSTSASDTEPETDAAAPVFVGLPIGRRGSAPAILSAAPVPQPEAPANQTGADLFPMPIPAPQQNGNGSQATNANADDNKGMVAGALATVKEHPYAAAGTGAVAVGLTYWFRKEIKAGYNWCRDQVAEVIGWEVDPEDDEGVEQQDTLDQQEEDSEASEWTRNHKIAAGTAAVGTVAAGVVAYKHREAIEQGARDAAVWTRTKAGEATEWVKENPKKSAAGVAGVAALAGVAAYLLSDDDDAKTPEATERGRVADKNQKKVAKAAATKFANLSDDFVNSFKTKRMVDGLTKLHTQVVKTQNPILYFGYTFEKPLTTDQQRSLHRLVDHFAKNMMDNAKLTPVERAHYAFVASLTPAQYNAELFNAYRAFVKGDPWFYQLFSSNNGKQEQLRDALLVAVMDAQ